MKKINKFSIIGLILLVLVAIAIPSASYASKNAQRLKEQKNSPLAPIIMIPGSSATVNRFDRLVAQINRDDHQNHSLLKVKVLMMVALHMLDQLGLVIIDHLSLLALKIIMMVIAIFKSKEKCLTKLLSN